MAVVAEQWPNDHYSIQGGPGPSLEMFVYVDAVVADLIRRGVTVIHRPQTLPWGERVGFVRNPDGNPAAIATSPRHDGGAQ